MSGVSFSLNFVEFVESGFVECVEKLVTEPFENPRMRVLLPHRAQTFMGPIFAFVFLQPVRGMYPLLALYPP